MSEHFGGDPARHLPAAAIEAALDARRPSPRDRGRVVLLVRRPAVDGRETPERVLLTVDGGMPGDRWAHADPRKPDAQLAVMEAGVGEIVANGQDPALFGDNLVLDLALDVENLPIGSRLRVGEAVLEVTPKAHNGCYKYAGRFGADALRVISRRERRSQRLRGLYLRVVEDGTVAVGDEAIVIERTQEA